MSDQKELLSERERETLRLVAMGISNKEVSQRLGISANTVKVHLRNIFAKLGVESRTEATMVAVREGWITMPETQPTPPPTIPDPSLPWPRRVALLVAALVTVSAVGLTWIRPAITSSAPSILPDESGAYQGQATGSGAAASWTERAQMPTRRAWLGLAAWGQQLYAIGGKRAEGVVSGAVEIYDPSTDTWTRGADKPTPAAYVGAAALGDRIFVPGGCAGDGRALSIVEVYDPAADTWDTTAPLPHPVCAYALAVYAGRLYLFGGTNGQDYPATTHIYTPESDRWEEGAPVREARALAAAATLGDRIYVVGGYRSGQELATCAAYVPATDVWESCPSLTLTRSGLGLVALGEQVYAIGGGGWGGYLGLSERYDPGASRWTAVEMPPTGNRQGAGVAALDWVIYTVGGYGDDYQSIVLAFEPFPFHIFIPATEK